MQTCSFNTATGTGRWGAPRLKFLHAEVPRYPPRPVFLPLSYVVPRESLHRLRTRVMRLTRLARLNPLLRYIVTYGEIKLFSSSRHATPLFQKFCRLPRGVTLNVASYPARAALKQLTFLKSSANGIDRRDFDSAWIRSYVRSPRSCQSRVFDLTVERYLKIYHRAKSP